MRIEHRVGDIAVVSDGSPAPIADARSATPTVRALRRAILAGDGLLAVAIVLGAHVLAAPHPMSIAAAGVAGVAWLVVFALFGLHRTELPALDEGRRVLGAVTSGTLITVIAAEGALTRSDIVVVWGASAIVAIAGRRGWAAARSRLRRRGALAYRTLIIGTGTEAAGLAHHMKGGSGYNPLGFVAAAGSLRSPNGLTVVGTLGHLRETINAYDVECLFVAISEISGHEMATVLQAAHEARLEVRVSTGLPPTRASRTTLRAVGRTMALSVEPVYLTRTQAAMKRTLDLVVAGVAGIVSFPAMLVIAAAIRVSSHGPALFKQTRVTKGGRSFTMLKFRSMVADAEARLDGRDPTEAFFKVQDDQRITRVGRFLRRTSLDELPQLWNIIRGDMSLVGPRPLPVEQVLANHRRMARRHEVRAGLTGWWQINGRSDVDAEKALELDHYYIENWSLGLDLYTLARTAAHMIDRKGAV